jgi:hypothetical protein
LNKIIRSKRLWETNKRRLKVKEKIRLDDEAKERNAFHYVGSWRSTWAERYPAQAKTREEKWYRHRRANEGKVVRSWKHEYRHKHELDYYYTSIYRHEIRLNGKLQAEIIDFLQNEYEFEEEVEQE